MIDIIPQPRHDHTAPRRQLSRPVRVCFLIDNLGRAGTEMQMLALLRSLDRTAVEPTLVLLDGENELSRSLEPDHCSVLRLGVKSLVSRGAYRAAREFARFLRQRDVDILQTYFLDSTYFGVPVACWAGVRTILRVRNNLGYWLTFKHRLLNRLYGRWISRTLTNSQQGRATLEGEGVPATKIAVLENGVDVERFAAGPPRFTGNIRIGAVANLRPVKCLDLLIRAAANLLPNYPNLRFEIAGDGPQRAELEALITELGVGECIRLAGPVADVPAFLASLDVAVLCSRSEGMSNAVLEYMAAGRAIVATRVGANEQLLGDGGLLIEPDDEGTLERAIARLLQDPESARQMGAAARQRACDAFSRDAMRRRFEELYRSLASA
jgi:glycosyltransferase involved in cell wall biosynthesis